MSSDDQLCVLAMPLTDVDGRTRTNGPFAEAASALGWDGVVVHDMRLFGQRVAVVAEVDRQAHERRLAAGWGPVIDRMSIALWQWPEQRAAVPPHVVQLNGIIAGGKRWQRVLASAGGFVGFCSTAILLEQEHVPNRHCLITAHLHGVAVLRSGSEPDSVVLVQSGRQGPVPTARPSVVSRWVDELVYQRLVDDGLLTASGVG